MVKETELYDNLQIAPDASASQIKKAYRQMAMKYHPDKNPDGEAAEIFKKASEAYEILSDPEKRQLYDQYGKEGMSDRGMGGMDPSDLFSQFFGGGRGRPQGPAKCAPIEHQLKCTLEELYTGKTSKLSLTKTVICKACSGLGGKAGSEKTCSGCQGAGAKFVIRQIGPMVQQIQVKCPDCQGRKKIIPQADKCKVCKGKKVNHDKEILEVFVDRGMRAGEKLEYKGAGDQMPDQENGDVVFVIGEKPHDLFTRRGNDLFCTQNIDILTALAGGQIVIPYFDKQVLMVNIVPGEVIKPASTKLVKERGMPSRRLHTMGDLFINFNVEFPDTISPEAMALLEKAFPPRKPVATYNPSFTVEDVELCEVDEEKTSKGDRMEYEDEEDHQPQVQCANQ